LGWIGENWYSTEYAKAKVFFAGNFRPVLRWKWVLLEIIFGRCDFVHRGKTGVHNWSGKPVGIF
jgi:hypothetical protein